MAYGDPVDDPYAGYAPVSGGLLGNPFIGAALGLLSNMGPSLTPKKPFAGLAEGLALSSKAQQEAQQNELARVKLAENAKQAAASTKLADLARKGGLGDISTILPGATNETLATAIESDPSIIGKLFHQPLDAATQAQLLQTQTQILDLQQKYKAAAGQQTAEDVGTLGDINNIATASERLDQSNSLYQPGGAIDKFGGLDLAAAGLQFGLATGAGSEETQKWMRDQYRQVVDAQTVSKSTAALAQNLQAGASQRSNFALANIQTALGAKMVWPAKRRIMVANLDKVFADIEERGAQDKVKNYSDMKELYTRLKAQDKAFTSGEPMALDPSLLPPGYEPPKGTTVGPPVAGTDEGAAAASASLSSPDLGAGPGVAPAQGGLAGSGLPPAAEIYGAGPGAGVPGASFVGGAPLAPTPVSAPVAPAPAAPDIPIKGVMTKEFGLDPMSGQPIPKYNYKNRVALERASKTWRSKGVKRIMVVGPDGLPYFYSER